MLRSGSRFEETFDKGEGWRRSGVHVGYELLKTGYVEFYVSSSIEIKNSVCHSAA